MVATAVPVQAVAAALVAAVAPVVAVAAAAALVAVLLGVLVYTSLPPPLLLWAATRWSRCCCGTVLPEDTWTLPHPSPSPLLLPRLPPVRVLLVYLTHLPLRSNARSVQQ